MGAGVGLATSSVAAGAKSGKSGEAGKKKRKKRLTEAEKLSQN